MCMIGKFVEEIVVPKRKAIIGMRGWRVEAGEMKSVGSVWNRHGPTRASCPARLSGPLPHRLYWCGLWAFKIDAKGRQPRDYDCFGFVALWGRVMVHERGYRAQVAQPCGVFGP